MRAEVWKSAVGHELYYEVSDRGRVRSIARRVSFLRKSAHSDNISKVTRVVAPKLLTPQPNGPGGHLFIKSRRRKTYVHRMVLETFVGPCPPGQEGRHADDVPTHNHLGNLSWGTHSQNMCDAYRNGRKSAVTGPAAALKAWATKRRKAAEAAAQSRTTNGATP